MSPLSLRARQVDRHRMPLSCSMRTAGSTPERRATERTRQVASDWLGQPPALPRAAKTSHRPASSRLTVVNSVPQPILDLEVLPVVTRLRDLGMAAALRGPRPPGYEKDRSRSRKSRPATKLQMWQSLRDLLGNRHVDHDEQSGYQSSCKLVADPGQCTGSQRSAQGVSVDQNEVGGKGAVETLGSSHRLPCQRRRVYSAVASCPLLDGEMVRVPGFVRGTVRAEEDAGEGLQAIAKTAVSEAEGSPEVTAGRRSERGPEGRPRGQ